jgi:hypothetical protein
MVELILFLYVCLILIVAAREIGHHAKDHV